MGKVAEVKLWCDPMRGEGGSKSAAYRVLSIKEIRKVVRADDTNFYALAEIRGAGALAVKEGSGDGSLYVLSYESDEVKPIPGSLSGALSSLLSEFK